MESHNPYKKTAYNLYFEYMGKWKHQKDLQSKNRKIGNREMADHHESLASSYQRCAKKIVKLCELRFSQ